MTINKSTIDGKTVFTLIGRLDALTSPELQRLLIPEFDAARNIELDFSQLAYISSAGLRILLIALKTANEKNCTFLVCNVTEEIMEILDMTGFASILTIKSSSDNK